MRLERPQIIAILIGIGMLSLIGLGLYTMFTRPAPTTSPSDLPIATPSTEPDLAEYDNLSPIMVPGSDVLVNEFSDTQYLFISQMIEQFGIDNFPDASVRIDEASFTKRDDKSYGFSVIDENNTHLFYIIVTKLDNGEVKVDSYL